MAAGVLNAFSDRFPGGAYGRPMKPLLPIVALLAAGCATAPPQTDRSYSALGTEPFWSISIAGGRMTYETPDGGFEVAATEPSATGSGRRYASSRITLDIAPWVCSDGMSDNLYADTVTAVVDGTTLHGCGGGIVPPETLVDSRWDIVGIGDEMLDDAGGEAYTLAFRTDRVVGRAGCNHFSGPYSRTGSTLTFGPIAATRMACPGPRIDHERRAFEVLSSAVHLDSLSDGMLRLTGPGGSLLLRRSFHAPYSVTPANPWELRSR